MSQQLSVDQGEKNARSCGQLDQFIGLPAKRCGVCGGCEFYISQNQPSPTCLECKPPTGLTVSRLYAVSDGSRLRYQSEPTSTLSAATTDPVRRERERLAEYRGTGRYWSHTATGCQLDRLLDFSGPLPEYAILQINLAAIGEEADGTIFEMAD